ncbi:hypothetical protein GUJ93_ZPchr0013g37545 [Zizania palustris]|uniref:Uncharacterized protein n=1 Tax=Zizania palustris TaxID=103762 RepID=A0A8J6C3U1_ZIZPA|nr:hypothetical protein GUJ93_ZPchr0013g37545 [Zizania palustris]
MPSTTTTPLYGRDDLADLCAAPSTTCQGRCRGGRPDLPPLPAKTAATAVRMLPDDGADDEEWWLTEGITVI